MIFVLGTIGPEGFSELIWAGTDEQEAKHIYDMRVAEQERWRKRCQELEAEFAGRPNITSAVRRVMEDEFGRSFDQSVAADHEDYAVYAFDGKIFRAHFSDDFRAYSLDPEKGWCCGKCGAKLCLSKWDIIEAKSVRCIQCDTVLKEEGHAET